AAAGLDRGAAPAMVPPGQRLGSVDAAGKPFASFKEFESTTLIAPSCHDTGSAVAGIPDCGDDWAFISSGTWSLVGAVLDVPCTSEAGRRENFTYEGGLGGKIRFLKNVNGLWLLEECMREWATLGYSWTAADLVAECARRPPSPVVFNVDAPELLLPGN